MKVQRRITWGCPSDWVENAKVAQVKVDQRHPGTSYIIPQGIFCCPDEKNLNLKAKLELGIKIWKQSFACTHEHDRL